jgi:hypothetical protein
MKFKLYAVLSALLVAALIFSTAGAGGAVKLSGVSFGLGSLIASGYATGLGNTPVDIVLDASGPAGIICTNPGSNDVPGQSYPKVSASGLDSVPGTDLLRKNGRSPFGVQTVDPETVPWDVGGCPNANWTARVDFIYWTNATIYVYDANTGELLLQQNYSCSTTKTSVSCKLVK